MPITLFDWLNNLTWDKKDWDSFSDEDKESFNPYLIHRFISMEPNYIELVNEVQNIPTTEKKLIYLTYKSLLPKQKKYFKYIKGSNKTNNDDLINKISEYYQCSTREAKDYLSFLEKEEILVILEELGIDKKTSKKLLK
jgi:hypothetical protein